MHRFGFDEDFLMGLEDVIKSLPNVKPRKARARLKEWQEEIFHQIMEDSFANKELSVYKTIIGQGDILTSDDFEHIFYGGEYFATKITPHGAKLLIEIYNSELLELNPHKTIENIPQVIVEYSKSEESIFEKQRLSKEAENKKNQEYNLLINNPQNVNPKTFNYTLLNDIFIKHIGFKSGSYSMSIGSVDVTKSVLMYTSNSGKSRDGKVTFTWVDLDGNNHKLEKPSYYSDNRRNDPERNWGLHE
ncbi:hypothetical protein CRYPA_859 [uncultured Candidatus Thioglobus sp.]|nr:hypothetical protein CRYPA_859 [uncultured Candidatus Thioglobus sp.]